MAEKFFTSIQRMDVMLAVGVIAVVFMLIIPIPAFLLDSLLAINLMFALVILLSVMYMRNAAEFSVFPSLLLLTTIFRLALNVSSTRMILSEGMQFESKIIRAFGEFVVGGNYVVGLVIFAIIIAVQFIVITKGATRISEVAARFRLDAMPNKYMAVDGELASGMITEEEAIRRRASIQQETDFYGSMDGASKFVKGDVIVGLLITVINILGGIIIGTAMRGESIGDAAATYLLFTVGDGLVSQIPALLLSTATGIIVTRAVSDGGLGTDISRQLSGQPRVLLISAGFLGLLGVLPGFPKLPLFGLSTMLVVLALRMRRAAAEETRAEEEKGTAPPEPEVLAPAQPELLELEIGFGLVPLVDDKQGGDLLERIRNLRRRSANELGIVVPPVRIRDNPRLSPNEYAIRIRGVDVAKGELEVDQLLVINPRGLPEGIEGVETRDPTFGQPARWIPKNRRGDAEVRGYTVVDSPTVLATHLGEILKNYAPELVTLQQTQRFMDGVEHRAPAVVKTVKERGVRLSDVQKILQNLLREHVSIQNMETILELVAEHYESGMRPDMLTEKVRQGLAMEISSSLAAGGVLRVVEVDGELEELLSSAVDVDASGNITAALDPETINLVLESATSVLGEVNDPEFGNVVLTTGQTRLVLHRIFEKTLPAVKVVSYNELSRNVRLKILGRIGLGVPEASLR